MDTARWLTRPYPPPPGERPWQLYCFPHAGGGTAVYSPWAGELAPVIELVAVCPPGRERHITARPHRRMAPLVDDLVAVLAPVVRQPYAFFGHSLGALVAFEVARALWRRGLGPAHLFASASRPPHVPGGDGKLYHLADDRLVAELTGLGGMPAGLDAEPDVLRLVLPPLRADLEVAATYVAPPGDPLPCGITALGGIADRGVHTATLSAWRRHTTGPFVRRMLPGGHFYHVGQRSLVLDAVRRDLPDHASFAPAYRSEEIRS